MSQYKQSAILGRSVVARAVLLLGCAAATMLAVHPTTARADDEPVVKPLSKWGIDVAHPDQVVVPSEADRNADPIQFGYWLQDLVAKASAAASKGDHATAAKLYEVLGQAVPDRAIGFSKACDEYEALGDREKATNACGGALLRDGVRVVDFTHFVSLMLAKPGDLGDKDKAALANVIVHLRADPAGRDLAPEVECQIATRTTNIAQLEECTGELAARAPNDVKTVTYQWALAVAKGHFDEARAIGERARAAGVPAQNLEAMDRMTTSRETHQRWLRLLAAAGAAIALAALGFGARFWRRMFGGGGAGTPAQAA